ncbi:aminopeptidase N [Geothermobacter hydrogeniphilus]|uniref:Aminopeptidase N n=1 Tax=Geothermobacter hydrogeniphilus TaxID=1969733 RepID=A0A1X0Y841_9BACT|nr:aminopeptidase N [Geothermobacter hydrogeniphilus]ORJ61253.1 aminopeptidase N [Geothermobacter hydrogeniphilus]
MAEKPLTIYRSDYTPPNWLVDEVELHFDLDPETTEVISRLRLRRNPETEAGPLRLDGEGLELLGVRLNGRPLDDENYLRKPDGLTFPELPSPCLLETRVRINPAANTALEGLYVSSGNFCTQCEAQGFRHITYYPDRPDILARFTTTIVADQVRYPQLLSNGNPVARRKLPDGRHSVTWEDPFPKPCYLFALVAGDLVEISDSFTTCSGRDIALRFYVEHHHRDKVGHAVEALKKAMRWDEEQFGREYDLDIYMVVAVDDFNMGAMENKGLNIFNSKYVLARSDTATDADFQAIEEVIAHEYFHNWTGNRITCRDWFQLSLKEGLTVFRDQEFSADQVHRDAKRIEDVRLLRNSQFPEDGGPMAHPVRPDSYQQINNFYTMTVYHKGAELIRMMQTLLGRDGFRKGMDLYFERHDGQAVTCDDFRRAMADANGRDLSQFERWYSQAGTPRLDIRDSFDAKTGRYRLRVRQSCPPTPGQPQKESFHLPLRIALLDREGKEIPLRLQGEDTADGSDRILEIQHQEEEFVFCDLADRPMPSLLRGFSAPVILDYPWSDADLAFLLRYDRDPFGRWDAGQQLACRQLLQLVELIRENRPPAISPLLASSLGGVLRDETCESALRVQLLTLPSETYLAEQMQPADPGAIHRARQFLRRELAAELRQPLLALYRQLHQTDGYRCTPEDAGRRGLKNLCLGYLLELEETEFQQLAVAQYRQADNMTDQLAALQALCNSDVAEREELLNDFHARWKDQPLVLDKWFTLQATSRRDDCLDQVIKLAAHPDFNLRNPNRARSLLGALAHSNPAAFHRNDGSGYRFIADYVLRLDRLNPQIAARLVSCFNRWRRMVPELGEQMRAELERIQTDSKLSRDVREIVGKALNG